MSETSNNLLFKACKIISIGCILISILVWLPSFNILFKFNPVKPTWTFTFILGPIGFITSLIGVSKYKWLWGILLAILNAIMFFSFFILMYIGYNY
ncbi:hypothetical protein [Clostridium novyi]|uniref:hypothetical protein n=1 Tax=Clostridium novyi TaxID=1542 RepID=UPI00068E7A60|nr:hypothetical protein [Clostridium novyi]